MSNLVDALKGAPYSHSKVWLALQGISVAAQPAPAATATAATPSSSSPSSSSTFKEDGITQHKVNRIKIKPGTQEQILAALTDDVKSEVKANLGFLGVEMFFMGEDTMVTHSVWSTPETGDKAAGVLGKVLGGALKEFIAAPPEPTGGTAEWVFSSSEYSAQEGDQVAKRMVTVPLKEGGMDTMLNDFDPVAMAKTFEAFEGMIDATIVRVAGGSEMVLISTHYTSQAHLEAATPKIAPAMAFMAPSFAGAPVTMSGEPKFAISP